MDMNETKLKNKISDLEMTIKSSRRELKSKMKYLAGRLNYELESMEEDSKRCPNYLGVVQGSGDEIDKICLELREREDQLTFLKSLLDEEEKTKSKPEDKINHGSMVYWQDGSDGR